MRAHEFIIEAKKGPMKKIDPTHKVAMKNVMTPPDLNMNSGSAYLNWRMGIALAGAPTFPTKMEADNYIAGDPLLAPYTDVEAEMVKAAMQVVGGGKLQSWSGKRSEELPDTHKSSPVQSFKGWGK